MRSPEAIRRPDAPAPRLRAAILGATGTVGQKFVQLLANHPWFEISALLASDRSAGRRYGEVVHWLEPSLVPPAVAPMTVLPPDAVPDCDFAFSGLDSAAAGEIEPRLAQAGIPVISNAGAFRMEPSVPLLVPEVNADHAALVATQSFPGFIATNPNCSTVGLVMAAKPLADRFGLESLQVTTLQAVSGAGYPGVASFDILGNVIPWIRNEEEKLESEPLKILGRLSGERVVPASFGISAQTNRVAVLDGHLLSISARLGRRAEIGEVRRAFEEFGQPLAAWNLPSAPARALHFFDQEEFPQPRLHAGLGAGMTVSIGRLRRCPVADIRFVALVHNTVRGAVGGALLNAELLWRLGYLEAQRPRRERQPEFAAP
ncbi:MAG TPA: aspartate-semialdehyde dehydrogenase [Thermoanaerobaculia bacterium]|nr:aspartate-semialdehyde dehydrogenase [Thermoanaerobaculia bacterium]